MTSKERLLAVFHRQPTDRLCWTALVDDATRSAMPAAIRELPMIEFYRHLGCDILCFGNFGLPPETCFVAPCRRVTPDVEVEWQADSDGLQHQRTKTPWGTLTATFRFGHPVKHPVGTLDELRILRNLWRSTRHEPVGDRRRATTASLAFWARTVSSPRRSAPRRCSNFSSMTWVSRASTSWSKTTRGRCRNCWT